MMGRAAVAAIVAAVLSLGATAAASGSFSVKLAAPPLLLEALVEQEVATVAGWTVYAGSGFAVSTSGVERLRPYTIACRELDLFVAYAEVCGELAVPAVGGGTIAAAYVNVVW